MLIKDNLDKCTTINELNQFVGNLNSWESKVEVGLLHGRRVILQNMEGSVSLKKLCKKILNLTQSDVNATKPTILATIAHVNILKIYSDIILKNKNIFFRFLYNIKNTIFPSDEKQIFSILKGFEEGIKTNTNLPN